MENCATLRSFDRRAVGPSAITPLLHWNQVPLTNPDCRRGPLWPGAQFASRSVARRDEAGQERTDGKYRMHVVVVPTFSTTRWLPAPATCPMTGLPRTIKPLATHPRLPHDSACGVARCLVQLLYSV